MRTRVLMNGKEHDQSFATDDRIFLGEGLFETLKVTHSKPHSAYLHWQRLSNSAQHLGIPFDLSYEHWLEYLLQKIKQDNLYHGGIKAILSGGTAPRGLAAQGQISQLMLQTFNTTATDFPLRLMSASWLRDAANPVYRVKSINYLEAILARRQALAADAHDALFFNLHHYATETTCANLFIIQNKSLLTPPLTDGVLSGITRSRIFALAKQHNITCTEVSLTKDTIEESDAVFITNSLQGIRPVHSLDGVVFAEEHPLMHQLTHLLNVENEIYLR